uniref:Uncharacterized protein n=1 Tax=Ditylenchus dipsaci TaxID=166011 RepID=A0A915DQ97_9BILA
MVESLIQQKRAVETYFGRHERAIEGLSAREWRLLKQLIDLSQPADAFTRDVCKNYFHLGLQIATWRMLLKEVESAEVLELAEEKNILVRKIESRFRMLEYDKYELLTRSLFLDPRFKNRCVADGNEFRGTTNNVGSDKTPLKTSCSNTPCLNVSALDCQLPAQILCLLSSVISVTGRMEQLVGRIRRMRLQTPGSKLRDISDALLLALLSQSEYIPDRSTVE